MVNYYILPPFVFLYIDISIVVINHIGCKFEVFICEWNLSTKFLGLIGMFVN